MFYIALKMAVNSNDSQTVNRILSHNYARLILSEPGNKETSLHTAVKHRDLETIKTLLKVKQGKKKL